MGKSILYVGLDVDDNSFHGFAKTINGRFEYEFKTSSNTKDLIKQLKALVRKEYRLKICYEATYLGFSLCRDLEQAGFDCIVIAPNLIPENPGKKVKTDKRDAKKLAYYFQKGLLTVVHQPGEEEESDRTLIRSRRFIKNEIKSVKCHLKMLCRKQGWHYRQETGKHDHWTKIHREWLVTKINKCKLPSFQKTMQALMGTINQLEATLEYFEDEITALAQDERYKEKHDALICYRGIKTVTAMTLIVEIGDVGRFGHPNQLSSYFGLDIAEYSSGGKERRFGITKQGNSTGRYTIIEANQNVLRTPNVSRFLRKRREGVDLKYAVIADRCSARLHKKAKSMFFRSKNGQLIKVACAREMLGFVWESLRLASGYETPRNIRHTSLA